MYPPFGVKRPSLFIFNATATRWGAGIPSWANIEIFFDTASFDIASSYCTRL
jgi:hypothetical protein